MDTDQADIEDAANQFVFEVCSQIQLASPTTRVSRSAIVFRLEQTPLGLIVSVVPDGFDGTGEAVEINLIVCPADGARTADELECNVFVTDGTELWLMDPVALPSDRDSPDYTSALVAGILRATRFILQRVPLIAEEIERLV